MGSAWRLGRLARLPTRSWRSREGSRQSVEERARVQVLYECRSEAPLGRKSPLLGRSPRTGLSMPGLPSSLTGRPCWLSESSAWSPNGRGASATPSRGSVAAPAEYRPRHNRRRAPGAQSPAAGSALPAWARRSPGFQAACHGRANSAPSNPSLERRPHEAGHPCAAQGSRGLHCPARRKGGLPRGSPQLER